MSLKRECAFVELAIRAIETFGFGIICNGLSVDLDLDSLALNDYVVVEPFVIANWCLEVVLNYINLPFSLGLCVCC